MLVNLAVNGTIATLTFFNDTPNPTGLAKARVGLAAADGDYFEFDPPVPYRGITVKRGPYSPDELVVLQPGERLTGSCQLADLYDFTWVPTGGLVRYRATVSATPGEWATSGWVILRPAAAHRGSIKGGRRGPEPEG